MRQQTSKKRGASLTGYGLVVGLIAVVGIGAITGIGGEVEGLFTTVSGELDSVVTETNDILPAPSASPSPSVLYSFSSHIFTNCGQTGSTGPSLGQCQSAYSAASWASDTDNFNITTPGIQQWTVPETGTYRFILQGAAGGVHYSGSVQPGYGGQVSADRELIAGETLYIVVGQRGDAFDLGGSGTSYFTEGGFNGGGGTGHPDNTCNNCSHASGGGATDIRMGGTGLANRIIVAGGGAGSSTETGGSAPRKGGDGGGLTGEDGFFSSTPTRVGRGGTQSAGGLAEGGSSSGTDGSFGIGGRGHRNDSSGGGGGWYGGGGGGSNASGGGGSSYTDGSFTGVLHIQGANNGHGSVSVQLLP